MTRLTVNGRLYEADIAARTHLADYLRETLRLTGTHLGCEHGVCGACTLLIDGEPARACLAYPALCDGADIRTIEGLADDPVTAQLRDAFSAEHALQCGYCTPGMLVAARDIVLRLPDSDDDCIRLELAGNLCRCTGYDGIVRAIRSVLDQKMDVVRPQPTKLPLARFDAAGPQTLAAAMSTPGLIQRLAFTVPADVLWSALRDPARIAACIPGATLDRIVGDRVFGTMQVALGPIRVRFAGDAQLTYSDADRIGTITGTGADQGNTRLGATARFNVEPTGPAASLLIVEAEYTLRGALAQLARPGIVDRLAGELAAQFGHALSASLTGAPPPAPTTLHAAPLLWRALTGWLRSLFR